MIDKGSVHVPGFKKKLDQQLLKIGMKLKDLPKLMGPSSSVQTIYSIATREMTTVGTLRSICKAIGVEMTYFTGNDLLGREEPEKFDKLSPEDCRAQLQASFEKINLLNEIIKQKTDLLNTKDELIRMLRVRKD